MRRSVAALLAVAVLGLAALAVRAAMLRSDVVQTLGVVPAAPVAPLRPGHEVCERPLVLADDVDAVEFNPGTAARHSPAVDVVLRDLATGRPMSTGRLAAGFDPAKPQTVHVTRARRGSQVSLCFRNRGPARMAVFGDARDPSCSPTGRALTPGAACTPDSGVPKNSTVEAELDGRPLDDADVSAILLRDHPRSLLARVPAIFRHASLFRPGFVGVWLWWSLLVGVVLAAPAGLAYAARLAWRRG